MIQFRALLTCLAFAALGACLPVTSKVPVGTTMGFRQDQALLGTWRAQAEKDDKPAYVHILANDDQTMSAVVISPPEDKNGGDWSVYRLQAATLGSNRVLNVQEQFANGKPSEGPLASEHIILLYRASGPGRITLYQMDDKALAAAIRAGEIAGEIEPGESGDVRLTAEAGALDKFMSTPRAAALFSKALVTLTRIP